VRSDGREIEDVILLQKACNDGCVESLAELHKRFGTTIRRYIQKAGSDGLAEDISQQVFTRICEGRCRYSSNGSVKSYLCGVARNILREQLRTAKIRTYSLSPELTGTGLSQYSTQQIPIETLESAERRQALKAAISKLPSKSRQAVELVYIRGIPASKAAISIGCDFKIFRKRLSHGLNVLQKSLIDL
jgi:RNA polymerase sigma-70 factor (ECF subfamily)